MQECQHISLNTRKVLAHLHCPSGCFVALRSLSHFLQCPSCHFVHFVLRSATLHHVRSPQFAARHGTLSNTQGKAQVMHIPFRKPTLQYSLGYIPLHYVLYSSSVPFSPPAANLYFSVLTYKNYYEREINASKSVCSTCKNIYQLN